MCHRTYAESGQTQRKGTHKYRQTLAQAHHVSIKPNHAPQAKGDPFLPNEFKAKVLAVMRGVLGATALVLFYQSMARLALKDAVTLFFTSPVWCALLERVFLPHDSPSLASVVACLLAVTVRHLRAGECAVWYIPSTCVSAVVY